MISRRRIMTIAAASFLGLPPNFLYAQSPSPNDPLAIVNAIYARVVSGNGDLGGAFLLSAKPKYFSKSLIALWTKAEAHTPKGDQGPIDFDPATNSQDPSIKSFSATAERLAASTGTIVVTMQRGREQPRANALDDIIRYDFVRDGGHWRIDDMRGAVDGKPWSIRKILARALKN